jgi:uncharacterized protein YyaL (SSP411 family)
MADGDGMVHPHLSCHHTDEMSLMRPNQRPSLDLSLPDTRPNQHSQLPDIRSVLPWRSWDDGREEAERLGRPIFVIAEYRWANSAQRVAFRLQQDDELRQLLTESVIPVLVDPDERPDLATSWRWAAMALTGTAGAPLMLLLTHEGLPFLAYCTMAIEGDDTYPSLASLVQAVAESYRDNPEAIIEEARTLASESGTAEPGSTPPPLADILDQRRGGLTETPKHPRPGLLWTMLEAHSAGMLSQESEAWLRRTLDALIRGSTWDQLDRGFHRAARTEVWVPPHFEKPVPLNAQLAAVYARAGRQLENDTYRDIASRTATFCLTALKESVDAIGSDTNYYTWTSRELLKTLDASLVQVVTLHYDIKPVDERQALRRVVEMEQMDRFSHEDTSVLQARLVRGRAALRAARLRRPSPETVTSTSLAWRATTICWLLEALEQSGSDANQVLLDALETLIDGRFRVGVGYGRDTEATSPLWLGDQAALLDAFLTAYRVSGNKSWHERAIALADALVNVWWSEAGWLDSPASDSASRDVVDDILPAAIPTLTRCFQVLDAASSNSAYAHCAQASATLQRNLERVSGHWAASFQER